MATIKLKIRSSAADSQRGSLYFRIIHGREARQISIGIQVRQDEWDNRLSQVVIPAGIDESRHQQLATIRELLEKERRRLAAVVTRLDSLGRPYTAAQVVAQFTSLKSGCESFIAFARRTIADLKAVGKVAKAERYNTCVNRFAAFLGEGGDVPLDQVDSALMVAYENWLLDNGLCRNSTSNYMRNLRAIYNLAVNEQLVTQNHPFSKVYTGVDRTKKRAIPMADFARIQALDLSAYPSLAYARDLFILLFLCQGMSFCDLAHLKKSYLKQGKLTYKRMKTGQRISVKWQPQMQEIVARYDNPASPYLLPIIADPSGNTRKQYKNALHRLNHQLKKIGALAGIAIPLTSYVSRHGWASNAMNEDVPLKVISQALGHESEATTVIYLMQLDTNEMDRANERLIRSLSRETERQRKLLKCGPGQSVNGEKKGTGKRHAPHSPSMPSTVQLRL